MLKTSLRLAWKGLGHLTRIALVGAALLVFACGALMLGLRYWILPDIERYRGIITVSASQTIGQPVTIGKIEADWQGMRPHLSLTDVRILDKRGQTALALPRVDNVVSWTTLLRGEVRLHSLELDRPELLVRRDAQGLLYIAGIALSGEQSDHGLADWLLHQGRIIVRDARIVWLDEQRSVPPLMLDQVTLLIENGGLLEKSVLAAGAGHHRFAVRALPPAELSGQLDVRGDFHGNSFDDLRNWRGQLFAQLDYVDAGALRTWLPLPDGFKLGKGALRGWLDFEGGKAGRLTADLALADVQAQLGDDLPLLDLRALRGRIAWQESAQGREISAHNFSMQTNNGLLVQPTDFYLRLATGDQQPAGGEVRANTLDLGNLTGLANYLPLGQELKMKLAEFAPRGRLSGLQARWQNEAGKVPKFDVKAQFDQLFLLRTANLPGFSGLSGEMAASERGGTLALNAHALSVDAPQFMPEPLQFDTLTAQSSWQTGQNGLELKFSNVSIANADVAGNLFGSFRTQPDSPGQIDLTINLTRAAVHRASRYIPLAALDKETHAWIHDALLDGQASEFRLRLHGDLKDFPYPENKKGMFSIRMRAKGVAMEYAREWPRIDNITAELLVQGQRLEVIAPSGATLGAHLQKVNVLIPDTTSPDMVLQVRGEALAETAQGLDFIQKSPVRGYLDGFTDDMAARGSGKLNLSLDVPLLGSKPAKVSGTYRFSGNEIDIGAGAPTLRQVNGDLLFTESSMHTRNASAQIFGGPATLSVQSGADGAVQARIRGKTDMDTLRKSASHPLFSYLSGGSEWEANIRMQKKQADVTVTSNLSGMASTLPEPFAKSAAEAVPLRFEMKSVTPQQDVLTLQYGDLLGAKLLRREEGNEWAIKRGTVNFGGPARFHSRDGVWLTGTVPRLALEGWGPLLDTSRKAAASGFAGADLLVQHLDVYGYQVNELRVSARNRDGALAAQLASREASGEVTWEGEGKGKLHARFKNLYLDKGDNGGKQAASRTPAAAEMAGKSAAELPALDLVVDDLTYQGKLLGRMELLAQHHGHDWLLERMRITNPDGLLAADGRWGAADGKAQTQINLKLEISDAGKILARSGYPNSVKNGSGKLEGSLAWRGGPDDFSYASLDGSLKLDTGKGQFLKIKPGIGKLLGILSLQALPRHITLDFTDVFSEGFAFDSITGTAQIRQGVLSTGDFKIDGSAAKVTMAGQIDLGQETQNLNVRILPTVGNSVSMLGALTGGPLVGIGTFIVNKLFREPLDKLVSFEYNVTGTWDNPSVAKVGPAKPAATDSN